MPVVLDFIRHAFSGRKTEQSADDVERHVDASGDAGGGDDIAIIHPAGFGHPLDLRTGSRGHFPVGFVGRGGTSIKQACGGEDGGSVADGHGDLGLRGSFQQPSECFFVFEGFHGSEASGHEEQIELRCVCESLLRDQFDALCRGDRAGGFGKGDERDVLMEIAPDFHGTAGIEHLKAWKQQHAEGTFGGG